MRSVNCTVSTNLMLAAVLMGLVNLHKKQENYPEAQAFFDRAVASRLLKSKPVWPTLTHTSNPESK